MNISPTLSLHSLGLLTFIVIFIFFLNLLLK